MKAYAYEQWDRPGERFARNRRHCSPQAAAATGQPHPVPDDAFELIRPPKQTTPLVLSSPHSGDRYPAAFLQMAKLDRAALRLSEDCYVDELIAEAPAHGVPLLKALFPRTYVDANREAMELDPLMFEDALPETAVTDSPRVAAGLGSIPRLAANDREIYGRKLRFAEAERRIETCYRPYHRQLAALISGVEALGSSMRLISPRNSAERGSQVSFAFAHGYAAMQALIAEGIIGDFRAPDVMRFGLTLLYISLADVDRAVTALARILREKTYLRSEFQTRAAVT